MTEWKDISTAPKDEDEAFLACDSRIGGGHMEVVFYCPSEKPGFSDWIWATQDGPEFHKDAFTHWQPLPPSPEGE